MDTETSDVPQPRRINRLLVFAIVLILILLFVILLNYVFPTPNTGVFSNIIPNL